MERWEYLTEIARANIDNPGVKERLSRRLPNFKPKRFGVETMIPRLDEMGQAGWELVHMQPMPVGENHDYAHSLAQGSPAYSNSYFCVFKRRMQQG